MTKPQRTMSCCLGLLAIRLAAGALPPPAPARAVGGRRTTPAPQIQIDKSKVDLTNHRLEMRLSQPPADVEIVVTAESGEELARDRHDFSGHAAGSPLVATWTPSSDAPAARFELRAHDTAGGFAGMAIVSWSISLPREEVVCKSDSAE